MSVSRISWGVIERVSVAQHINEIGCSNCSQHISLDIGLAVTALPRINYVELPLGEDLLSRSKSFTFDNGDAASNQEDSGLAEATSS